MTIIVLAHLALILLAIMTRDALRARARLVLLAVSVALVIVKMDIVAIWPAGFVSIVIMPAILEPVITITLETILKTSVTALVPAAEPVMALAPANIQVPLSPAVLCRIAII